MSKTWRNILLIGLAVSISFNLFFAVGFVRAWHEIQNQTAIDRLDLVSRELNLTSEQQGAYNQMKQRMTADHQSVQHRLQLRRAAYLEALEHGENRPELVQQIVHASNQDMYALRTNHAMYMNQFTQTLEPKQRARLVEIMRAPRNEGFQFRSNFRIQFFYQDEE